MQLQTLVPIPASDLDRLMPWILERCDLPEIDARLRSRRAAAYIIAGTDAALVLSVGTTEEKKRGLWVESLGGSSGAHSKRNISLLKLVLDDVASIGKTSDCHEIRIEANNRTALKLKLFPRFGFTAATIGKFTVMRKVL